MKDLFIDPSLMKPIDRLTDIRFLKEHGVDKIYKIDTSKAVSGNRQYVILYDIMLGMMISMTSHLSSCSILKTIVPILPFFRVSASACDLATRSQF